MNIECAVCTGIFDPSVEEGREKAKTCRNCTPPEAKKKKAKA